MIDGMARTTIAVSPPPDEERAGPDSTRRDLFGSARRSMVPVRHIFVQKPREEVALGTSRGSTLAWFVRERQSRALDLYLLSVGLFPVLSGTPLPAAAWARLVTPEAHAAASTAGISKVWSVLEDQKLIGRQARIRRLANVLPLHESGSGQPYQVPGLDRKGTSKGYFYVPGSYWLENWQNTLSLPAKAMLLIWLSATHREPAFSMTYEQTPQWYGLSERTAERGIQELLKVGLMTEVRQRVRAPRTSLGFTYVHHRMLTGDFSYSARNEARKAMARQARRAATKNTAAKNSSGGRP